MSDNKKVKDKRDRSKIDSKDPSEVEYAHQQVPGLKHEQVVKAVKSKGPSREKVMDNLKKKK